MQDDLKMKCPLILMKPASFLLRISPYLRGGLCLQDIARFTLKPKKL